jgi:RHS repeat-associated protein
MQSGANIGYFVQDHLGSTNALTDATGNVVSSATYDSYGNTTGNIATRYQYTGREKDDATGLTYYRARWYSGELGRFISEDPIGFGGRDINLFGYVHNNSINRKDPLGLLDRGDYEFAKQATEVGVATAGATGAAGGLLGIGAISVSAAPVTACGVAIGGFAISFVPTYYFVGEPLAQASWNPYVNGPLNPFTVLTKLAEPQTQPQLSSTQYPKDQPPEDTRRCGKDPNSFKPAYKNGQQICSYGCIGGTTLRLNNAKYDPRLGWYCPTRK